MGKFTVTSLTDDGTGGLTLREALAAAEATPGSDIIDFDPSFKDDTIVLEDRLVIDDADGVTIRGDLDRDGEVDITISGDIDEDGRFNSTLSGGVDDARRIDGTDSSFLYVEKNSNVTIVGVELDNGYAAGPADETVNDGTVAVIINKGNLEIRDSKIDGVKVKAGGEAERDAAVVWNKKGGKLTLTDVIFDDAYVQGGVALRSPEEGRAGGHASLIHNEGRLWATKITTSGRFYGGAGVAVSDSSGDAVTDGGDGAAWIINEGRVLSDKIVGVRTGHSLTVSGGARGVIVDVTEPIGPRVYGAYGTPNSTDLVINKNGGTFDGTELRGVFADQGKTNDDYSAGPPNSNVTAPSGGVTWMGLSGKDTVTGSKKGDYLYAGGGADLVITGKGKDIAEGQNGDDELRGRDGADTLRGGEGNDLVRGDNGADQLFGGNGRDTIKGGKGDDTIAAGKGNDTIEGNAGDDRLTGGNGVDRFVFFKNDGNDKITDFKPGTDKIVIKSGANTFNKLDIKDGASGAVVKFDGTKITLLGVNANDIDAGDFIF